MGVPGAHSIQVLSKRMSRGSTRACMWQSEDNVIEAGPSSNLPRVPGVELRSPGSTSCPMETSREPLTFRCCPRPWAQHPLLENCTYESTAPTAVLTLKRRWKSLQSLLWDSPYKAPLGASDRGDSGTCYCWCSTATWLSSYGSEALRCD